MIRILIAVLTSFAVASLSGCAWVGKGKAPPPVIVTEPVVK